MSRTFVHGLSHSFCVVLGIGGFVLLLMNAGNHSARGGWAVASNAERSPDPLF